MDRTPPPLTPLAGTAETEAYLRGIEGAVLRAALTGSSDHSRDLDAERRRSPDGLAGACLELLRRRGWGGFRIGIDAAVGAAAAGGGKGDGPSSVSPDHVRHDAVAFYALTTLQRSPMLTLRPSADFSDGLRTAPETTDVFLRSRLRDLLLRSLADGPTLGSMPRFVATKVGVLLALLVRADYPTPWSAAFEDVRSAVGGGTDPNLPSSSSTTMTTAGKDAYVRFLDAVSDEIVYPSVSDEEVVATAVERQQQHAPNPSPSAPQGIAVRNEQVRDAMRGYLASTGDGSDDAPVTAVVDPSVPLERTDAARAVGWLLDAMEGMAATADGGSSSAAADVAARAAAALVRYLPWADARVAADPSLVRALLEGLGRASPGRKGGGSGGIDDTDSGDDDDADTPTRFAAECARCLREVATRGVADASKKIASLSEMGVFGRLCRLARMDDGGGGGGDGGSKNGCGGGERGRLDLATVDETHIDAVVAAAELIDVAGAELVSAWESVGGRFDRWTTTGPSGMQTRPQLEMQPQSAPVAAAALPAGDVMMRQCLTLTLACLNYDDIDVSSAVVNLVSRLLAILEKECGDAGRGSSDVGTNGSSSSLFPEALTSRILDILHLRMKYPPDHAYDYEDEDEAEEEEYRSRLRKLYQRVVRFRPDLALGRMRSALAALSHPLSSADPSDVEVALRLVHHYGEGRRPPPGARAALRDEPFRELIVALHRSDISRHPHREVLLLYYDVSVRYAALLKEPSSSDLLSSLLGALTGERGLQHPHPRVRGRCCYLFLRLVKSVGGRVMRSYVESAVDGIQSLLFSAQNGVAGTFPLAPNDAMYLFETTGILLGKTGLDADVQRRCAAGVITPHVQAVKEMLRSPDLTSDPEAYGERLAASINAIAQLSKGWQKHPPVEVQDVLFATVDVCRGVLAALPAPPVRSRCAVFLQRMILCVGERILPSLPEFLAALLSNCADEDDLLDVSQLLLQVCIKFRSRGVQAIDGAVLPFLRKVLDVQRGATNTTEQLSARKLAFAFLHHTAVHGASAVLYSERNVGSMGDVLRLMSDGAATVDDPVMKKSCLSFFLELIRRWGGKLGESRGGGTVTDADAAGHEMPSVLVIDGFFKFIYDTFVPGMVNCVLSPSFKEKDALQARNLSEFGNVLAALKASTKGGVVFESRTVDCVFVRVLRCPPDVASGFRNAGNGKEMELCLKALKNNEGRGCVFNSQ